MNDELVWYCENDYEQYSTYVYTHRDPPCCQACGLPMTTEPSRYNAMLDHCEAAALLQLGAPHCAVP